MRIRQTILTLLLLVPALIGWTQSSEKIHMISESSLYVSGDMIRLQLVAVKATGVPVSEDRVVHTYLVNHSGQVVLKRKFLITEIDKAGYIPLPEDLETGNYKLVACQAGADSRTVIEFPVYNPNIFSSSVPPKNADINLGLKYELPANNLRIINNTELEAGQLASIGISAPKEGGEGVMTVKVFDPLFETPPLVGSVNSRSVPSQIDDRIEFEYISRNPNSRISLYFVEQGYVEEFYLADEAKIIEKLPVLFGSGHLFAYQFDQEGNRLGEVPATVIRAQQITFDRIDNTVPFDRSVQQILEKKRVRKYVDQVYRTDDNAVVSLMAEEFDTEPDRSVVLENFSGVVTLREALANITPKTQVIRRNGKYEIRLSPESSGFRYGESPLVLINGVPAYDLDSLFEMEASRVNSIDLYISLEKLRRFGTFGRFGVVSINLARGEENPWQYKMEGLPEYFGVSDLVSEPVRIEGPDLRPVPFWDPAIRLRPQFDPTFRFQMSNVAGDYIVWSLALLKDGTVVPSSGEVRISP